MVHLLLATRNRHKTREFAAMLGSQVTVSDLSQVAHMPVVEETGRTFEENAVLKAVAASHVLRGLVVADDSGLEVAVLSGAPGVFSARYAGEKATDADNVAKLLTKLRPMNLTTADRSARFCCALALVRDGKVLEIFRGSVEGHIATAPEGESGFGYDPVFIPTGYMNTFAALGSSVKDRISHRARAIEQLRNFVLTIK